MRTSAAAGAALLALALLLYTVAIMSFAPWKDQSSNEVYLPGDCVRLPAARVEFLRSYRVSTQRRSANSSDTPVFSLMRVRRNSSARAAFFGQSPPVQLSLGAQSNYQASFRLRLGHNATVALQWNATGSIDVELYSRQPLATSAKQQPSSRPPVERYRPIQVQRGSVGAMQFRTAKAGVYKLLLKRVGSGARLVSVAYNQSSDVLLLPPCQPAHPTCCQATLARPDCTIDVHPDPNYHYYLAISAPSPVAAPLLLTVVREGKLLVYFAIFASPALAVLVVAVVVLAYMHWRARHATDYRPINDQ